MKNHEACHHSGSEKQVPLPPMIPSPEKESNCCAGGHAQKASPHGSGHHGHHHHHHQAGALPSDHSEPGSNRFTCPMHPEIVQDGPGSCPLCGMALEPMMPSGGDVANEELLDMTRRFKIGLLFAVPLIFLDMGGHLFGLLHGVDKVLVNGLQLLLATPVVLWAGWPFFERGWQSFLTRNLNMFSLIAIGTGAAWSYSVVATIQPGLFPSAFRAEDGSVAVYFEAAAVITILVLLGQILELRARESTSSAIKALLDLSPKQALRVRADGTDEEVSLEQLMVGDHLRIRPGEKVPVDGILLEGRGNIDESMVTGESMPVVKESGAKIIGGTLNLNGSLIMRAEKVGRDTLLARIVELVAHAQRSRAPIQRLADQVANWFVPMVLVTALSTFVVWAIWGPSPAMSHGLIAAVAVLIIACPCALGLATPVSIMVGIGRGAQLGVLIRDASALEHLAKVDTLIVDKTGTLTAGKPKVTRLVAANGWQENEVLRIAASLERASEHPLAQAVIGEAEARGLNLVEPQTVESMVGKGISGQVEGRQVRIGSARYLEDLGIATDSLRRIGDDIRGEGATAILVAIDQALAGLVGIADPIKETTPAALSALVAEGIRIIMVTGDNHITAQSIARQLGIQDIEAEVLPDRKSAIVEKLKAEGKIVAMAGDGVNDAPALAAAEVGIAMGTGTDIAMESAGITLVKGDLLGIVRARQLSRLTLRNIRQNLFFAFAYNVAGVPLAAGVLYPWTGDLLSPVVAAAAMALSSVSVIGNALRLTTIKI